MGLPVQAGERYLWEWCELDRVCHTGLHVFGETEGWRGRCGFCVRRCVLNEVPAQESGWGCFSSKLSRMLGCPGEAAELISSAPGTESASQLSGSRAELPGGQEVRRV